MTIQGLLMHIQRKKRGDPIIGKLVWLGAVGVLGVQGPKDEGKVVRSENG